jgi:hypothetical protein
MTLSLGHTPLINKLADALNPFLPGTPHPYADPRISFKGIARDLGVAKHWYDGSKRGAVTELLARTYELDKAQFVKVVLETVRRGLSYREVKDPVGRREVDNINALVFKLGLRIKDLVDPQFLESLPGKPNTTKQYPAPGTAAPEASALSTEILAARQRKLREITALAPTKRGFAFEAFLGDLFHACGLGPRKSFRLVGEQIDGSFHRSDQTYLVEAKWQATKTGQGDLLVFAGKVGGKAQWSRGVHVSLTGYSIDGLEAFARGKPTNIICVDGLDLHYVLDGKVGLWDLIVMKSRRAAESNEAFVSVRTLMPGLP